MEYLGIDWSYRRAAWCSLSDAGAIVGEGAVPADADCLARLVLERGTDVRAVVGFTTVLALPESASAEDILAIVASIAAVALGVLCGVELHAWLTRAGGRVRRVRRGG